MPDFGTNKFEKYCNTLIEKLQDDTQCTAAIIECCKVLDTVIGKNIMNRDTAKDASISGKLQAVLINRI